MCPKREAGGAVFLTNVFIAVWVPCKVKNVWLQRYLEVFFFFSGIDRMVLKADGEHCEVVELGNVLFLVIRLVRDLRWTPSVARLLIWPVGLGSWFPRCLSARWYYINISAADSLKGSSFLFFSFLFSTYNCKWLPHKEHTAGGTRVFLRNAIR